MWIAAWSREREKKREKGREGKCLVEEYFFVAKLRLEAIADGNNAPESNAYVSGRMAAFAIPVTRPGGFCLGILAEEMRQSAVSNLVKHS